MVFLDFIILVVIWRILLRYEFGVEVIEDKLLNKSDVITSYHNNGEVSEETVYKNGLKNGVSRIFNTEGNIVEGNIFKDGSKKM